MTRTRILVALIVAAAAVNLFVNLGSSSLYVDEGISWGAASEPTLGEVVDRVRHREVSPPLHYLGLHEVLVRASQSEVGMRLPSALAGLALVVAILWLGTLVAGKQAGVVAAALAALSPLVLEYGQQARGYVFAMLAATIAAGALVEGERARAGSPARKAWLAVVATAAIVGFWTHYTAGLVCVALFVSSLLRRGLRGVEAGVMTAVVGAGWLLALPIMLDQFGQGRSDGLAHLAFLSVGNVVELVGAPFDTRFAFFDLTLPAAVGASVVAAAGLIAARNPSSEWPLVRSLVLPAAFLPAVAVLFVTVVGQDALLTRYVAVSVPFMLVLVGAVHHTTGRAVAALLVALAGTTALSGSLLAHRAEGRYADWRSATIEIAKRDRPGDAVLLYHPSLEPTYAYYAQRNGLTHLPALPGSDPQAREWIRQARRLWVTLVFPPTRETLERALGTFGYRAERTWHFKGSEPMELVLAVAEKAARTRPSASRRP